MVATAAVGTHPTGLQSCTDIYLKHFYFVIQFEPGEGFNNILPSLFWEEIQL